MTHLAPLDWLWLILFLLLMIGTGVLFYRLARRSEADFFLAGRRLPWWLPAVSVYATHTATDTPIFVTGVVFLHGVSGIWYTMFPVWAAVSAFTSTRIFRRSVAYTIAEWQNLRFGGIRAEMLRGWFAGWQFFMSMFVLGWVGAAMGKITTILFGWPAWVGIVGFSAVCAIYVLAAGYWGVVVADFQQGIIAFLLILLVSIWALLAAGGPAAAIDRIARMNSSWTWEIPADLPPSSDYMLEIEARGTGAGAPRRLSARAGPFQIARRAPGETDPARPSFADMFTKTAVLEIVFPKTGERLLQGQKYKVIWSPLPEAHALSLRLSRDHGRSWEPLADRLRNGQAWRLSPFAFTGYINGDFPLAWFLTMLMMATLGGLGVGTNSDWFVEAQRIQSARTLKEACFVMLGGGASVLFRNGVWVAAGLGLFSLLPQYAATARVETAWYEAGFRHLPVGMVGLFVAAIVAIHLSTVSTRLNLGAMYATRDLYHHYLKPDASERDLVWVGRVSTAILLLGSFVYGMMITEITQWLVFAMWIMFAGVWLPNILQVVWWRFNAWGYLASWVSSLVFGWLVVWVLPLFGVIPKLPDFVQFWVLLVLGALLFLPLTLLTPPEDMDHLVRFYLMTRPIGFWGPVKKEALRRGLLAS
jgi:Na+/proline symporter